MQRAFRLWFQIILLSFITYTSAQADVLDKVLERKSLVVGVSLFTPWTFRDGEEKLVGYEIDMANRLAADLGVTADLKVYPWEEIIPALQKGEIDVIAAGMAITPQRALQLEFSRPYMSSGVAIATHLGKTKDIKSLDELNRDGIQIAVVKDTLSMDVALQIFDQANVHIFPKLEDAHDAVINGKAVAYVGSVPEATFFSLSYPGQIDLPLNRPLRESRAGFGVRKGEQSLLNFLNAWIESREADGTLKAAQGYWFRSLEWRPGAKQ